MENIKDKITGNKTASVIVAAIVILIIILGVLLGTGKINLSADNQASVAGSESEIQYDENGSPIVNDSSSVELAEATGPAMFSSVRIPVFASPDLFDYSGKITSCGEELAWTTVEVAPTAMPLNATLQSMFNRPNDLGFTPGNFMASQTNLNFEEAVIESGVAKIKLNGSVITENDCDSNRLSIQIREAALQFDTVNSVEISLNGQMLR